MNCLFLSETIITAKLLFQQVCALSPPNHLAVRRETGGNDGGMATRNRWSVEIFGRGDVERVQVGCTAGFTR